MNSSFHSSVRGNITLKKKIKQSTTSPPLGWLSRKQKRTIFEKDMEKLETLRSIGGNVNWYIMENSMVAPQKIKNRINHMVQQFHS